MENEMSSKLKKPIWKEVAKELPSEKGHDCWITGGDFNHLLRVPYFENGSWMDFFGSYEAAHIYSAENGITHWCDANTITLPDEEESNQIQG